MIGDCDVGLDRMDVIEFCPKHGMVDKLVEALEDACERLRYYGYAHEVKLDFEPLLRAFSKARPHYPPKGGQRDE